MLSSNQSSPFPASDACTEFTWSRVPGNEHDTGQVTHKNGALFATTASPEDAERIANALNGQAQKPQLVWPKERDVGRFGDMSPHAHIRVGFDSDNDVYVSVWDDTGGASIEFCQPGGGGGKSSRTRLALIALMQAMEADNADTPALDWWARRRVAAPE